MSATRVDRDTLRTALELASRAPSVHNTQPWRWRAGDRTLHLYADRTRQLSAADADGRDLVVSCGALLHHARVALAAVEVAAVVHRLPNPADPDHLAALELFSGHCPGADLGLAGAITARRTDRRRFTDWPVPDGFEHELVQRAADQGTALRPATDPGVRRRLTAAIRAAAQLQEAAAGYPVELALWSGVVAGADGVPVANVPGDLSGYGDLSMRRYAGTGLLAQTPAAGDVDGATLYVLATASDDPLCRLRAGEAASAVMLHATELGLAGSPLSQPLEIGRTRAMVREEVLDCALCPQLILRIGWAPTGSAPPPLTPRRPIDEVFGHLPR
ncbi:Acg family FMN-binding oxidoreductase [Pseudonocardia acidicola]|uniref:NAD(P)H nitroreductase n=1 Tax=Pseudonocardia acidicola TaxID=2724939 RepID=A0ABX1SCL2_9PSEU|nr:NAD(P)H nitroreductase [Pseudonocardia acidicola]NMH99308.1 NAD(P)H nitroreductase [Pseudonocardia acidicola]